MIFSISWTALPEHRPPPGWESNPDFAYVGRKGKGHEGRLGNPFPLDRESDRGHVLHMYEQYLVQRLCFDDDFRAEVRELAGKNLVCFCVPLKCHAEILERYAKELASRDEKDAMEWLESIKDKV